MVSECFYERVEETDAGGLEVHGRFRSTHHTVGPWDRRHQHAGPPTALLVRALERLGAGPESPLPARVTVEILAPVPVSDLLVRARVDRPGRKVAWCTGEISPADEPDRPVVRLQAWLLRRTPEPLDLPATEPTEPPPAGVPVGRPEGWGEGYLDAVAWQVVDGGFTRPGPATVWTALRVDVVGGEEPSGVQRLAAVADSGSGISALGDPRSLLFVNTDLTLHLSREPQGEHIWMSARTTLDPHGIGVARTTLGDRTGAAGTSAQMLFVAPR